MDRGEHRAYIDSPEWAERRDRFKRDHGHRCLACRSSHRIEVHHIRYDNAGAGLEPDRDLRVLCRSHHQLAHEYEKSGRYGTFMSKGTLARATSAMISDVRAERTEAARTASPAPTPTTAASRPATRTDSRRPRPTGRGRRRGKHSGAGPLLTVAAIVALILVVSKIDWSTPAPTEQQPAATTTTTQAPVIVPPLPPRPEPYVVQAGDTMEKIARQSGVTVDDLLAWNPTITNPDVIDIGQPVTTAAPTG